MVTLADIERELRAIAASGEPVEPTEGGFLWRQDATETDHKSVAVLLNLGAEMLRVVYSADAPQLDAIPAAQVQDGIDLINSGFLSQSKAFEKMLSGHGGRPEQAREWKAMLMPLHGIDHVQIWATVEMPASRFSGKNLKAAIGLATELVDMARVAAGA